MNKFFVAVAVLIISTNCYADDFESATKAYTDKAEPKTFAKMMNAYGAVMGNAYLDGVKQGSFEDSEKKRSEVGLIVLGKCNEWAMTSSSRMVSQEDTNWNAKVDKAIREGISSCHKTFNRAVGN